MLDRSVAPTKPKSRVSLSPIRATKSTPKSIKLLTPKLSENSTEKVQQSQSHKALKTDSDSSSTFLADVGDEAASWFSEVLQTSSLRLVRMSPSFKRSTDPLYAPDGQVIS